MHVAAGSRALVLEGYLGCDGGQGFCCSIMEAQRLDQTINDNAWEHRDIDKAHLLTSSRTQEPRAGERTCSDMLPVLLQEATGAS